ncbi:MAG TPA: penicillin-binding transpeptidase domain-containing protein [Actinopolymorphaceae bacterium]|nr:penicillin-binding transpeptidase domain-containing protein [Actinopolymorphaceae bacterium]
MVVAVPFRILAAGALLAAGLAGCAGSGTPPEAAAAARTFAASWSAGKPGPSVDSRTAKGAAALMADATASLRVRRTQVRANGKVVCPRDKESRKVNAGRDVCHQQLSVEQDLAGLGAWTYSTTAQLRENEQGRWKVWWTPATFYPKLTSGTRLTRHRELPPRASILDKDGRPLTENGPVVRVGVEPRKVDPAVTYDRLGKILGIGTDDVRKRAAASPPTQFVHALTLRQEAYDAIASDLDSVPGVVTQKDTMSLAPTSSYARAVLGVVGAATKETLPDAGPLAMDTDLIGVSGLQRTYQRQLAGEPGGSVELVDAKSGKQLAEVFTVAAKPGTPLRTTIDPFAQEAAEAAVEGQRKPTAIVAVRASTGAILAAANGPGITSYNRAFVAHYPPGSTFKVVSVAALLQGGLKLDDRVACPSETHVGGKMFKNANSFGLPDGPMLQAFAHSCNTTVVDRAETLDNAAFVSMAQRFGIGEPWKLGVPAFSGSVPEPKDLVDRAASMIGQGRVEMSPLGMALVAATADSGQPRTPVLLPKVAPGKPVGEKLPEPLHQNLRALMRAVVETGSAQSLNLAGEPVFAKTGTAEYGTQTPPRTHAWMIGFRGDMAFAVLIEDGGGGGHDAGPVALRFLQEARFVQ